MTNRVRLGAVVLLVFLAGCFGGPSATPTATSVQQSPTDSPTPTVGVAAPGVPGSALENVTALLDTHNRSLHAAGFVLEVSSGGQTFRYRVASDGSSRSIETSDGSIEGWGNESVSVLRRTTDDGVAYEPAGNELSAERMTRLSRLDALLSRAAFARTGTTDCGNGTATCVSLHADSATSERYANFTADLEVDTEGVVRSLEVEYVLADEDGSGASVYRYEVVRLGDVAPTEPGWIGAALAAIES